MVRTVSMIKDGSIVKSHSDYPITNGVWKLNKMSLSQYLDSLKLKIHNIHNIHILGVNQFYLRHRDSNQNKLISVKDPWNRNFVLFPSVINDNASLNLAFTKSNYDYCVYGSDYVDGEVYVLVTTVNGMCVYCVDVVNEQQKTTGKKFVFKV